MGFIFYSNTLYIYDIKGNTSPPVSQSLNKQSLIRQYQTFEKCIKSFLVHNANIKGDAR